MARTSMGTQGERRMGQTPLQNSMTQVRIRCQILDGTRGTGIGLTLVMPIKRQLKKKETRPSARVARALFIGTRLSRPPAPRSEEEEEDQEAREEEEEAAACNSCNQITWTGGARQ